MSGAEAAVMVVQSIAGGGGGGTLPTILQSKVANVQAGNDVTATFDSDVTAGSTIVVLAGNYDTDISAGGTCVDSKGNTYTRQVGVLNAGNAISAAIWTAPATTGGSSFAVTFDAGTGQYTTIIIVEVADATGIDITGSTTDSDTSITLNLSDTTENNCLVLGGAFLFASAATITAAGGFSTVAEFETGYVCGSCVSKDATTAGAHDPAWTISSSFGSAIVGIALQGTP